MVPLHRKMMDTSLQQQRALPRPRMKPHPLLKAAVNAAVAEEVVVGVVAAFGDG